MVNMSQAPFSKFLGNRSKQEPLVKLLLGRIEIETARWWFGTGSLKTTFSKMTFSCFRRRIQDTVLNTGVFHACGLSCSDTGLHASFGWTWKVSTTGWPVGHGCVHAAKSRKIYAKKV